MIAITELPQGCILPVHAQPRARKSGILGEHAGALKIAVTEPPEDGRANKALVGLLAKKLGLKRSQVELVSGQTSREKRFRILDVSKTELENRVAGLIDTFPERFTGPGGSANRR